MLKELRTLAYLSMALVAIAYGSNAAHAAPTFTSAGSCTGADTSGAGGADCVATVGHISASVVSTLTINELRAISFGNMNKPCAAGACAGGANAALIRLDPVAGTRTYTNPGTDALTLLNGAGANAGGNALPVGDAGGFSPGVLEVKGAFENAATQVYISFADNTGLPVDFRGDNFNTANDTNIHVIGPGAVYFTVKDFEISCTAVGADVYGHYCDNNGANAAFQVKVGATLATAAQTYVEGKYVGTYNAMVSY